MKLTEGQVYTGLLVFLIVADGLSAYLRWLFGALQAAVYSRIGDAE